MKSLARLPASLALVAAAAVFTSAGPQFSGSGVPSLPRAAMAPELEAAQPPAAVPPSAAQAAMPSMPDVGPEASPASAATSLSGLAASLPDESAQASRPGETTSQAVGRGFDKTTNGEGVVEAAVPAEQPAAALSTSVGRLTPQPTKRPHDPAALQRLLDAVSAAAAKAGPTGKRPIVLFDIDDTLTDSGARNLRILREFLEQPSVKTAHPQDAAKLEKRLQLSMMRYYYADTFIEAGVDNPVLLAQLQTFWKARFFRNDYIPEDPANPGAVAFVKEVAARGGIVVYLTGRWSASPNGSMEPGTLAGLAKNGFPAPDGKDVLLVMKPNDTQPDAEFKDVALEDVAKLGEVVGGFENEPKNINVFKAHFPSGRFIFLDTKTAAEKDPASGKPIDTADGIAWVADFLRPRK